MNPAIIVAWALLLIAQNASFTIVSRARNSGSDWYHAVAAVFSNGIWFVSNGIIIFNVTDVIDRTQPAEFVLLLAVYIICTVFGSVVAGKFARTVMEKGNRRVGHYEGDK
ncbi:MAG: hypothetical protein V3S55_10060 [Nitrospiraceae bacterium]